MPLPCTRLIFSSSVISFSTMSARSSGDKLVFIQGWFCFASSVWPCKRCCAKVKAAITTRTAVRQRQRGLFIFTLPEQRNVPTIISAFCRGERGWNNNGKGNRTASLHTGLFKSANDC